MNRRLFRRMMRNHDKALDTLLGESESDKRQAAQKYLDDYPVEKIIELARQADGPPQMTRRVGS